jgi:hypothetical protein
MDAFPASFTGTDTKTQQKIVGLGLYVWSILQSEIDAVKELNSDELIKVWKEKGRAQGYAEKEKVAEREMAELRCSIEDLRVEKERLARRLEVASAEATAAATREFEALKAMERREARLEVSEEMARLRAAAAEDMAKAKEEILRLRVASDFKSAFEFAQKQFEAQKAETEALKEKIAEMTAVRSSYLLGKDGEAEIEGMLRQLADFDFLNVHAEADKADFRITSKDKKVMILDSKKFTHAVPKKDREKLLDNTDKDAAVSAGIMVSLNSKVSARGHCEVEFTPLGKPVLYMCLQGMTSDARLCCLEAGLKLLLKLLSSTSEKERGELIEKMNAAAASVQEIRSKMENIKKAATEALENAKLGLADVKQVLAFLKTE